MLTAKECFCENGIISGKLEFYEFRSEQLQMALSVEDAIRDNKVLIAEAGPGVGKSLAYLVPFINWAVAEERKVVVSTYTKALQNQLFVKDLPLLKDVLGVDLRFSLCMGSGNYICLKKAGLFPKDDLFDQKFYSAQVEKITRWIKTTETGLVTDMDFIPDGKVWEKFRRESDLCYGKRCRHYEDCFFMSAKRQQAESHLLVANHALLFTALKEGTKVLPDFNALVVDEAHTLEDVATGHFGLEFTSAGLGNFMGKVEDLIKLSFLKHSAPDKAGEAENLVKDNMVKLRSAAEIFFHKASSVLAMGDGSREFRPKDISCEEILDSLRNTRDSLLVLGDQSEDPDIPEMANVYAERADKMMRSATVIFRDRPEGYVFWADRRGPGPAGAMSFNASPIDVSRHMKESIFEKISPVVLTSATLSSSSRKGDFTFFKERLGIYDPLEIAVDSPYNYKENVLFYLPDGISDPVAEKGSFKSDLAAHITAVYDAMGGRIFALFTSYDMLNAVASAISSDRPDIYIMKQGDMPRYVLLDVFKKNNNGILFGTTTFWQGVDVPGSSLECVIVTRLPFGVPTDPVNSARMRAIRESGGNPFVEYQMPQALIMFKQGFGRLIRGHSDRGVFAVLDPRIRTREYGKRFLSYLPKCDTTKEIKDVRDFFSKHTEID
ncbi:MAG: helicase C-terminal domain-containing protein [Candidatus Omnitrophota bacterium]